MRLLLGLVLIAATPAFAAEPKPQPAAPVIEHKLGQPSPLCADSAQFLLAQPALADRALPAKVHPLIDEPSANMELTVLRGVNGCHTPVIVRYDVDGPRAIPDQRR